MEFRVLGPLEVVDDEGPLALQAGKQRALLACLLLRANRVVSSETLIDVLWGEDAPETAMHTLHVYVSQLRKVLRQARSPHHAGLVTEGRGYMLRTDPDDIDLDRFERIAAAGRQALEEGEDADAAARFGEALGLWRGQPLSDLPYEGFPRQEIVRLEELYLAATEDRIEADLRLGRHTQLVGELKKLVRDHPLRERLCAQLMLALYRSNRQAEALQAYRDAQLTLSSELGIDPSSSLQRLERAILNGDQSLEWHPRTPVTSVPEPVVETKPRVAFIGAILVLVVVVALVAISREGSAPPSSVSPNAVGKIDASTAELQASIPTAGAGAGPLTWADGSLWVANTISGTVARIDPATNRVSQSVPTEGAPTGLAAGEGAVWVLNGLDGEVRAIDPRTNRVTATIDIPEGSGGIAVGAGYVWVTNSLDVTVTKLDPVGGEVLETIRLGPPGSGSPESIAVGHGAVWVGDGLAPAMWKIDAATDAVVANPGLRGVPTAIAVSEDGKVWVAFYDEGLLTAMDPTSLNPTTFLIGQGPADIATAPDAVWIVETIDGTVSEHRSFVGHDPVEGRDRGCADGDRAWRWVHLGLETRITSARGDGDLVQCGDGSERLVEGVSRHAVGDDPNLVHKQCRDRRNELEHQELVQLGPTLLLRGPDLAAAIVDLGPHTGDRGHFIPPPRQLFLTRSDEGVVRRRERTDAGGVERGSEQGRRAWILGVPHRRERELRTLLRVRHVLLKSIRPHEPDIEADANRAKPLGQHGVDLGFGPNVRVEHDDPAARRMVADSVVIGVVSGPRHLLPRLRQIERIRIPFRKQGRLRGVRSDMADRQPSDETEGTPPVGRSDLGHAAEIQRVVGGAPHVDIVEWGRHQSHGHEDGEIARFPVDAIP